MKPKTQREQCATVEKKPIFIQLPFKGDATAEHINRRLYKSLSTTFPAATLRSWFTTYPMLNLSLKDKLPVHDQSMLVYSFSCCCAAEYIGRTTRKLSKRIKEHHPAWIGSGVTKAINSAIISHLVETDHRIDTATAFKVLYKVPGNIPKAVRKQILATAESIAIRLRKPILCVQKSFVRSLQLPWPSITPDHSSAPIVQPHVSYPS